MKIRILLIILFVGIFCSFITGCKKEQDTRVPLRLIVWGDPKASKVFDKLVRDFNKKNPDINLTCEYCPWSRYRDKLLTLVAGGKQPDVARMSYNFYAQCANAGIIDPLDKYVKADKTLNLNDIYKPAIDGWAKYKGKYYMIPNSFDMKVMFYNKNLFDKYHLAYPTNNWTMEDVIKTGKVLSKDLDGDGKLDQWGFVPEYQFEHYVIRNGGKVFSDDGTKCLLDQPAAYEGIQKMVDMTVKYKIAPRSVDAADVSTIGLFEQGKVGMMETGNWHIKDFKTLITTFEYGQVMMPAGKVQKQMITGSGFGMIRNSKHPKEAWRLINYLCSYEGQMYWATYLQDPVVRKSVANSWAYRHQPGMPYKRVLIDDVMNHAVTLQSGPWEAEIGDMILNDLGSALLGKEDCKTACFRASKRANGVIAFYLNTQKGKK